jgi:hypothetical protein
MAKGNILIGQFNRGIISRLGLARVGEADSAAERVRMSAEIQTNWIPRVLGSMMLRPGLEYITPVHNNAKAICIPYLFSTQDTAKIEMTNGAMRVLLDDAPIVRTATDAAITNGAFNSSITGWTSADEAGCLSTWDSGGNMSLRGTGYKAAKRYQQVSVGGAYLNTLHGIRVIVERGQVTLRVGSAVGAQDYFSVSLGEGVHSLAFSPSGSFYIELSSKTKYTSLVNSIEIEGSGDVVLSTPWAEEDLHLLRWAQSSDVIYIACKGYSPYKIERRGITSWSLSKYLPSDGPFRTMNITTTRITPSALSGDITLTASDSIFLPTNIGSLMRIASVGQRVQVAANAEDQFTNMIRITGVDASRIFSLSITGTWAGTITLQRSSDEGLTWTDINTYTTNTSANYDDGLDNNILYYRMGFKTGGYTSGTATIVLSYASGSLTGVARIVGYTSGTQVSAIVLEDLGNTDASEKWEEGRYSNRRGWPTACGFYEGRFSLAGIGRATLSESDAFEDFDSRTVGESGPIDKPFGVSLVDNINWIYSGSRLVYGSDGGEITTRQAFDEVITPSNFGTKYSTRIGSAPVPIAAIDNGGVFVQREGTQVYQLIYDSQAYDFTAGGLTELVPEIGEPSIVCLAVQRQPDTRIHAVRGDGKVAIFVTDPAEGAKCWILFETDGFVEYATVMPGSGNGEDAVYYIVKRTINGVTKRYWEKWAIENECQGGALNKQADSFYVYEGTNQSIITGLSHLEGKEVVAWGNGKDLGIYTVSDGEITLSESVIKAVIGLPYVAQYKSVKLAYLNSAGTALTQRKRIDHISFVLSNTHKDGLYFGRSFDKLDPMPSTQGGVSLEGDILDSYDYDSIPFNGTYDTDSRFCLQANAPKPCTVLSVVISMQTNDRI